MGTLHFAAFCLLLYTLLFTIQGIPSVYYGSGIKNSYAGDAKKPGTVYSVGEIERSQKGKRSGEFKASNEPLFSVPYQYAAIPAEEVPDYVKANAGAGVLPVVR